jgi:hypothetical protein
MSLLRDIQSAAIDGTSDLETLLRKCRVLAARLKQEEFKNWVQWELDGYPAGVELPDYRKFHCQCFGHFSGGFGSGLRNAPIPESCIPKDLRDNLTHVRMHDGVAALKDIADGCKDGALRSQWPADANPLFGHQIYEHMVLGQGWMLVPKSALVGILSTVRNRILNFALEIEASNPSAGEATPESTPVPKETVSQIFHTHIYGSVGNVASGQGITQTATVNIQQGDFCSLAAFLRKQRVDDDDVRDLQAAVESEPTPSNNNFGKKVSTWIGKMVQKSAEGSWKVTTTVASNVLTSAIKAYYGF